MIFAAPWVLAALIALPVLWWLLRATPPAPRAQNFPAIRLLSNLRAKEETPARTPWWLLALRIGAAALVIIGLAGPILTSSHMRLAGGGPALLVIDDGFAAGPDFAARLTAAGAVLDRLERARRPVSLLTTARGPDAEKPVATAVMPASQLRPLLAALRPKPWPTDRETAASVIPATGDGPVFYISDALAGPGDDIFGRALAAHGRITTLTSDLPPRLLTAAATPEHLTATVREIPARAPRTEFVLAETTDGRVLSRTPLLIPAGAASAEVAIALPPELRNQLGDLRLSGAPGAGTVFLLDEAARRRPVGLVGGGSGAETPLLGDLFYLERALGPTTELRRGTVAELLARPLSMLVDTSDTLSEADTARLTDWVRQGGLLVRFASPGLAPADETAAPDTLLPARLLPGDRQLGGAMSWTQPAHLAPFPEGSPFAGLRIPAEVTISRQVLADPAGQKPQATWARLADGTPLVTAAHLGAGELVLFHVTANADWSNLPLSGLFVAMLNRLVQRSAGVAVSDDARLLPPALSLDGEGVLGAPTQAARPIAVTELAHTAPSPQHPPGLYGPDRDRHAFNLASDRMKLVAQAPMPGAEPMSLEAAPRERPLGPWLIGLALALLCADMVLTLRLRGLLENLRLPSLARSTLPALLALSLAGQARAQTPPGADGESPALATHLAYLVTGDTAVDTTSRQGLAGLAAYVNSRTAATLADPLPVVPGHDDLSFYPLIYFPITPDATLSPAAIAALNDYMHHGGIILIDLRGGGTNTSGSGAGFAPDTGAALRRIGAGLDIPRLAPLTSSNVLAHAFYLLSDFPGRFDGDTVWVQQDQDRSNDSVSPVIVGSNDWAAAWAQDEDGNPLYATIPGGARQRTLAFRFGVNVVMYALTGNYKGDQVHVPAILERLGQ
jgi:hypothetical protein